jgi:hypothetical protein
LYVDERPVQSLDLTAEPARFVLPANITAPGTAEIRGFSGKDLVARYRMPI